MILLCNRTDKDTLTFPIFFIHHNGSRRVYIASETTIRRTEACVAIHTGSQAWRRFGQGLGIGQGYKGYNNKK